MARSGPRGETLVIATETVCAVVSGVADVVCNLDPYWAQPPAPDDEVAPGIPFDLLHRCRMFSFVTAIHPNDPLDPLHIEESDTTERRFFNAVQRKKGLDPWSGLPLEEARRLRQELARTGYRLLRQLGPSRVGQQALLAAFSAWCRFALGVLEDDSEEVGIAAEEFARISAEECPGGAISVITAAADIYQHLGRLAEAETQIRRWVALGPKSADARKRLAEVLYKQDRVPEATEMFETYVRLSDETPEASWVNSLTLRLGLEAAGNRRLLLESAAEQATWAPMGQRVAEWQHPWLSRLCPEAKRRWWAGLYVLSSSEARENLSEQTIWEMAADAFGEAVAMELRHSVLQPFREAHPGEPLTTPLPDHWKKAREGHATLGNLLHCLMNAKYPPLPVGRSFSAWLQQHKRPLFDYICRRDVDLLRLAKLRGAAQHDTVTLAEARQVFEDAVGLLQHIV